MEYKGFYISRTNDCDENIGGLFCQIYTESNFDREIDNFCIHNNEMDNIEGFIKKYIDSHYDDLLKFKNEGKYIG